MIIGINVVMSERIYRHYNTLPASGNRYPKLLRWARQHTDTAVFLNSNGYLHDQYASFPWVLGVGAADVFHGNGSGTFDALKDFEQRHNDWLFGFFSYELKNQLENLQSENPDPVGMPPAHFFRPVAVILPGQEGGCRIGCLPGFGKLSDPDFVYNGLLSEEETPFVQPGIPGLQPRVSRARYLRQLQAIKDHIQAGDIYELNYCVEFFREHTEVDPLICYEWINRSSPTPFSCFYMLDDKYLMCASPERFMKKQGSRLIAQPIKGTSARGGNMAEDTRNRQDLFEDPKERSENVMIVDLMRNDLSRSAQKDSVKVEELFGIYSFSHVHQMISTITSRLDPSCHYLDAIRYAFPVGSMTGAPKVRAMELIEQYEDTRRGLYAGSVGYISPEKDFDFNVVIRSLQYNAKNAYLGYMAGGAITAASVPEREYEECLLKARAVLG
ncbi:MAG: anthranilate synthase component I family protein [Bacteroidales bacterium]